MRPVVDPRLSASLGNFYPSKCTVQLLNETDTPGGPVPGAPTNIIGMINLQCRLGPLILIRPTDTEDRTGRNTTEIKTRQLKINGYFPQIDAATMQIVVDNETFSILGNEEDGNQLSTRLRLEVIRP